jgi:predicted  nucleic acid-binding Zn-ribbon protein
MVASCGEAKSLKTQTEDSKRLIKKADEDDELRAKDVSLLMAQNEALERQISQVKRDDPTAALKAELAELSKSVKKKSDTLDLLREKIEAQKKSNQAYERNYVR